MTTPIDNALLILENQCYVLARTLAKAREQGIFENHNLTKILKANTDLKNRWGILNQAITDLPEE